jgi:hypothetical protein
MHLFKTATASAKINSPGLAESPSTTTPLLSAPGKVAFFWQITTPPVKHPSPPLIRKQKGRPVSNKLTGTAFTQHQNSSYSGNVSASPIIG